MQLQEMSVLITGNERQSLKGMVSYYELYNVYNNIGKKQLLYKNTAHRPAQLCTGKIIITLLLSVS